MSDFPHLPSAQNNPHAKVAYFGVAATEHLQLYHSPLPRISLGIHNLVLPVRHVEKSDGGFKERSPSLIKNKNEKGDV